MVEPLILRNLAWAPTSLLEALLLVELVRRQVYRVHSAFFVYILATLLQSAVVASAYRIWGFQSFTSWTIAWGSQAVVIGARWFAVAGISRRMVAGYTGIWKMTTGIPVCDNSCPFARMGRPATGEKPALSGRCV
jgi:hypothetical protein